MGRYAVEYKQIGKSEQAEYFNYGETRNKEEARDEAQSFVYSMTHGGKRIESISMYVEE